MTICGIINGTGDAMYNYIVDFFKYVDVYDEELFKEIQSKTKVLNLEGEDVYTYVGIFNNNDSYRLILPKLTSFKDVLIYIHEYSHIIFNTKEKIIPNIMESLFINNFIKDEKIKNELIKNTENELDTTLSDKHYTGKIIKLLFLDKK